MSIALALLAIWAVTVFNAIASMVHLSRSRRRHRERIERCIELEKIFARHQADSIAPARRDPNRNRGW